MIRLACGKKTADPIEAEGIRRTRELIAASDIIIAVADGCGGIAAAESFYREELLNFRGSLAEEEFAVRLIRVWNKADEAPDSPEGWMAISALNGSGFAELVSTLRAKALENGADLHGDAPIIDSVRQKNLLERAAAALLRFETGSGFPSISKPKTYAMRWML